MGPLKSTLRTNFKRCLHPRKPGLRKQLLHSTLNSGFRRNDGSTAPRPWRCRHTRSVWQLVCAGVYLLLLTACSVALKPAAAPKNTPTPVPEVQLLATATAVAPSEPEMLARLARECRYRNCDEPNHWGAISPRAGAAAAAIGHTGARRFLSVAALPHGGRLPV